MTDEQLERFANMARLRGRAVPAARWERRTAQRVGDDGEHHTETLGWELANRVELRPHAIWWRDVGRHEVEGLPAAPLVRSVGVDGEGEQ